MKAINLIFVEPIPHRAFLVHIEDDSGKSIHLGTYTARSDGLCCLRITAKEILEYEEEQP